MISKQLSNVAAALFIVGVPLIFTMEYATQRVLLHPLGLFLLVPVGILVANLLYVGQRLSRGLIILETLFFVLWALVCVSVFGTSISTENGLGSLFTSFFNDIGVAYSEAETLGLYIFILVFLLSLSFVGISVVYAAASRLDKNKT